MAAPNPTITITLEEYDRLRGDISTLLNMHSLIRRSQALVMGEEISDHDKLELKMSYHHFLRDYPVLMVTN